MNFQPYPTKFGHFALAVAVVCALIMLVLIDVLLRQTVPSTIFWLLVATLLAVGATITAVYCSIIGFKLKYHLNRNGLIIQWGLCQKRIPLHHIEEIIPGEIVKEPIRFRGFELAGLRMGRGESDELGRIAFHTTAPLERTLLVLTPEQTYGISPQDPSAFLKAWHDRQALGPTQHWCEEVRRGWPLSIEVLVDPLCWWLVGSAAVICLALLGYVSLSYAGLPTLLPVHFDNFGQADRIVDKFSLFILPAVGAIALGVNLILGGFIHHREKVAAYMLWGSTIVVQLFLWIATLTITV